ncbi:MAG: hypothetical protein ACOC00_06485, partial [Halothiobacillaceae bacterium]
VGSIAAAGSLTAAIVKASAAAAVAIAAAVAAEVAAIAAVATAELNYQKAQEQTAAAAPYVTRMRINRREAFEKAVDLDH